MRQESTVEIVARVIVQFPGMEYWEGGPSRYDSYVVWHGTDTLAVVVCGDALMEEGLTVERIPGNHWLVCYRVKNPEPISVDLRGSA